MTAPDLPRLRAFLAQHLGAGDFALDVLRHEVGAVLNRSRLTGSDEGMNAFNTDQLSWVAIHFAEIGPAHPIVVALALSAAIDARWELWRELRACGLPDVAWPWLAWADGFAGDEDDLLTRLAAIGDTRTRCGAASLAVETAPLAVGEGLLTSFLRADVAMVYHRLLEVGLRGERAAENADVALRQLAEVPEVLFATDVDLCLAGLVRRCAGDPERHARLLDRVAGELTAVARAERLLRAGRAPRAQALAQDMRLLSPAYPQAMVVAALAALEAGDLRAARRLAERIEDAPTRLKVRCRVAQSSADVDAELSTLVELHELMPEDPEAFVQLVTIVERLDQHVLSRQLCLQAQEHFCAQPDVMAFIRRRLV